MPVLTLYRTEVEDGVVIADSELVSIDVDDSNGNGEIDWEEWVAFTGDTYFSNRGNVFNGVGYLWDGLGGSIRYGTLYTPIPYSEGDEVASLILTLNKKFWIPLRKLTVPCYTLGTLIATPEGEVAVESLAAGDLVTTVDAGPQPLVWTGSITFDAAQLRDRPKWRPVRIAAGALGGGLPRAEMRVSPQHMVRVGTGADEALVRARHLAEAGVPGITVETEDRGVTYVHLALADHALLLAEGAAMESFRPGPLALSTLAPEARDALRALYPALAAGEPAFPPVRPVLNRREALARLKVRARTRDRQPA